MEHQCQHTGCGNVCCTQLENIGVTLEGNHVLKDVNLHIHCGEITAIIGPNGGGKSTLIKAIIGEIPFEGKLGFQCRSGKELTRPTIGYVPQTPQFDAGCPVSVLDLFISTTTSYPVWFPIPGKIRERVKTCLKVVGMEEHMDKKIGVLSGGELQRVLLALALEPTPQILVLDEPSSGIDTSGLSLFYSIVDRIRREFDLTIIVVSHDMEFVQQYADRLALVGGTVLCAGTPDEVFASPEYQSLFGKGV